MTIRLVQDEAPEFSDAFTFEANGLDITAASDLETQDEVVVTFAVPQTWELLYRGGSEHNIGQLVLRRII